MNGVPCRNKSNLMFTFSMGELPVMIFTHKEICIPSRLHTLGPSHPLIKWKSVIILNRGVAKDIHRNSRIQKRIKRKMTRKSFFIQEKAAAAGAARKR